MFCEPEDMAEGCVEGAKPNMVLELCRIRETKFVMTLLPTQSNLYEWTNSQTIPNLFWRGLISSPHLISWKWRKGIQKIVKPNKSETIRCREQYLKFTLQTSSPSHHLQPKYDGLNSLLESFLLYKCSSSLASVTLAQAVLMHSFRGSAIHCILR